MKIVEQPAEMQQISLRWRSEGETVGFVPTMGALHEGHLSLLRQAREECSRVVASIFVNPLQFGPQEDFTSYPRSLEDDVEALRGVQCDALFMPSAATMYGERQATAGPQPLTSVEVLPLGAIWEGVVRPGHLRGVATVVAKLLNITMPHRAYLGEKDYQQLLVVRKMVLDLNFPLVVVPVPTAREADGLAMSSRNARLSPKERTAAPVLYRALRTGLELAEQGESNVMALGAAMQEVCEAEPLLRVQYIAIVDARDLTLLAELDSTPARALIAARVGAVRLIDNLAINAAG